MTAHRIDAAEALTAACAADDQTRPGWDYPLRLDSAKRIIASGAEVSVAAQLYGIDEEALRQPTHRS